MSLDINSVSMTPTSNDAAVSSTTSTNDNLATGHHHTGSAINSNLVNSTSTIRAIDLAQTNRMATQVMESYLNGKEYQHQQSNEWSKCIVDEVLEKIKSTQTEEKSNRYKYIGELNMNKS